MDAELAEVLDAIGPRLRQIRQARGLTLPVLAEQSGLSVSALSRIETGHQQPMLDVLIPLAGVHRVSLDQLVAAPETGDPRVHLEPYASVSGGVIVPLTQYPDACRSSSTPSAPASHGSSATRVMPGSTSRRKTQAAPR